MSSIVKIFLPSVICFVIGILITPAFTRYFYRFKLWKGMSRSKNDVAMSEEFQKLHNDETETNTPRVGGIIIWGSVLLTIGLIYVLKLTVDGPVFGKLDFLSRNQTLIPLLALLFGGLFGLFEDFVEILTDRFSMLKQGLPSKYLIVIVATIGFFIAIWFYTKLGMNTIYVPFFGYWQVGIWFIPIFILVTLGTFSSRVIDGVDGLAGGVMAITYGAFGIIAFIQNQVDIATFCMVIAGGILAFLWFNIPPARFYMGETGMLALTLSLVCIVFLTDSVFLFPIVGALLVATSISSTIQIISKRLRGPVKGKVFRVAPLHLHFQAIGWTREKITMRYWILSLMFAVLGVVIALIS
jgi:phospho-N-acetylmuramoyl-pentapeptide-transferase